jgi:hypothetical protein
VVDDEAAEDEVQSLIEEVVQDDEPTPIAPVAPKPEEVEELAASRASAPESTDDDYDHSVWDDGEELELADDDETMVPAHAGNGHGRLLSGRWWETDATEPAA